jgi:hypothetical protein
MKGIASTGAPKTLLGGWMDGWVGGWMDGRESGVKDCLQQSKNCLYTIGGSLLHKASNFSDSGNLQRATRQKIEMVKILNPSKNIVSLFTCLQQGKNNQYRWLTLQQQTADSAAADVPANQK